MKFYFSRAKTGVRSFASAPPPLAPGVSWVQFGDETLYYGGEATAPASRGARLEQREHDVARPELHLVVQNGRLFQQQFPDVPVLHDRGRFLLVQLDPAKARGLHGKHPTCFEISPVADEQVVFDVRPAGAARAPVPFVQNLVDRVQRTSFEAQLNQLVSFTTRH